MLGGAACRDVYRQLREECELDLAHPVLGHPVEPAARPHGPGKGCHSHLKQVY